MGEHPGEVAVLKVAVVMPYIPFVSGGAEYLAGALVRKVKEYGHESILVKLPFLWYPPEKILEHVLASRCVKLSGIDRVIAFKFPAYFVPHDNKVLWLLHQFRQAYDFWGTQFQDLPSDERGLQIRAAIMRADNTYLPEFKRIYSISPVISARLKKFNGIDSEPLYTPLENTSHLVAGDYGNYIFYPSRITAAKRQELVVESMKYVKSGVRLVLTGSPENPSYLERLERVIEANGLGSRVTILPHFISEQEKAELLSGALACAYTPWDEDSFGYVTLEACYCRKPVITCTDSGGTNLLVRDGVTGFITPPDPAAIADAFDKLHADKALARSMGEAGFELMHTLKISWDHVIASLIS